MMVSALIGISGFCAAMTITSIRVIRYRRGYARPSEFVYREFFSDRIAIGSGAGVILALFAINLGFGRPWDVIMVGLPQLIIGLATATVVHRARSGRGAKPGM